MRSMRRSLAASAVVGVHLKELRVCSDCHIVKELCYELSLSYILGFMGST